MANSDYTARGLALTMCPSAVVPLSIAPLATSIVMASYSSPTSTAIRLGSAAMLVTDDTEEMIEIVAQAGNTLTIARGCGDTIPQAHAAGATIWFFDDYLASDQTEYAGNATIGAKPLPRTVSRGPVPIEHSPPTEITFAFRFARPYPPGLVEVNGDPFYTVLTMEEASADETIVLTWAHRNRVTQADLLVDHLEASITPEVGTTYRIDVYDDADTLLETYAGITGETWSYSKNQATIDSGATTGNIESGYLILTAVRDGYDSWQSYRVDFQYRSTITARSDLALLWNILN